MSPNGRYILNDMEFERDIEAMDDRKLMLFIAKLAWSNAKKISHLENRGRRTMGISGGIGAVLGAAGASFASFFFNKGG